MDRVHSGALVSFALGPVQPFIAGARSVRDLWTGSFLLSWLTFAAMKPIRERMPQGARFILPSLEGHPLWLREQGKRPTSGQMTTPCLPNVFVAWLPEGAAATQAAEACANECHKAWSQLCKTIHDGLESQVHRLPHAEAWDRHWQQQIESFFEVRVAALSLTGLAPEQVAELVATTGGDWQARMDLLGGLMAATRMVRHVPAYRPEPDPMGFWPAKCSLMGTYEQMGPAGLAESRQFWEAFARQVHHGGSRVRAGERLCALSLIKRFAWPLCLHGELGIKNVRELRYGDTATVAAALWLRHEPLLNTDQLRDEEYGTWNGQWLHWPTDNHGAEEQEWPRPSAVGTAIREKIKIHGPPPTYYAILMLDGDHMGDQFRQAGPEQAGVISAALTDFAVNRVPEIVEDQHYGELIYAGGDDVLAVMPTETVLACAAELNSSYQQTRSERDGDTRATVSAGIAVVHYKEDLRFALEEARRAEKLAKEAGRDILALTICRRSGEHTTVVLPWSLCGKAMQLVRIFTAEASDRWAYRLRAELPTLQELPPNAVQAETRRLLNRLDPEDRDRLQQPVRDLQEGYLEALMSAPRSQKLARALEGFVILCQSASFLARGRDPR